jgi:hypothetical protein
VETQRWMGLKRLIMHGSVICILRLGDTGTPTDTVCATINILFDDFEKFSSALLPWNQTDYRDLIVSQKSDLRAK